MPLAAGTRLGACEITGPLGAGGMGEVYRATDTNLKRDVAIKVLPESLATAQDRLARFQREAEVLASLNHANIAQIYGIERGGGTTALVMELVEGPTLADRIAQRPIPVDEALGIAAQIADALEAAHVRGIVHRDLKPANVKLAPDGTVKVLDFGIAKALDVRVTTVPGMPALTTPAMTAAGIVLGTAAYMSPEQARGRAVDQRADIWAYGCVLYEMLTGQHPFGGEDVTIVLARVLERSPDWRALPGVAPAAVRRTLELCLEKDPRSRIADIRDVKLALAGRLGAPEPEAAPDARSWRSALPLAAAALAVGAVIAGAAAWNLKGNPPAPPGRVIRAVYAMPEGFANTLITQSLALSHDGRWLAYGAPDGIRVRALDALEARTLRASDSVVVVFGPRFSPDGSSVAHYSLAGLQRTPAAGGPSLTLAYTENPYLGFSWAEDGMILYGAPDGIWEVPGAGGEPRRLIATGADGVAVGPQRLPNGWILYTRTNPVTGPQAPTGGQFLEQAEIVVESPATGERRSLAAQGVGARYLPSGHLVLMRQGVLYAAPFDVDSIEARGAFVPVLGGIRTTVAGVGQFDVSNAGDLAYIPGPVATAAEQYRLGIADRGGALTLKDLRLSIMHVRASPDGARLAIASDDGAEMDVYIVDREGATAPRRLTFEGRNAFPIWSPDGERIAFQSNRGGGLAIYAQRSDGSGGAERLTTPAEGEAHVPESWSPDGRHLSFGVSAGTSHRLFVLSLEDGRAEPFGNVESDEPIGSVFSPDGNWLAYHMLPRGASGVAPSSGVFVEPFPPTGARYQAPKVTRDFHPVWSADGTGLHYLGAVASGEIATVRVSVAGGLSFSDPTFTPFELTGGRLSGSTRAFDALPGGGFVGPISESTSATGLAPTEIHLVVNWLEELERLVPTD